MTEQNLPQSNSSFIPFSMQVDKTDDLLWEETNLEPAEPKEKTEQIIEISLSEINPPQIADAKTEEKPTFQKSDIEKIKINIASIQTKLNEILLLLEKTEIDAKENPEEKKFLARENHPTTENDDKIVEGSFNGTDMLGDDGKIYKIPPNYASKSRLVEGDRMKLSIKKNGSFLFKQTHPLPRKRNTGVLVKDEQENQWLCICKGRPYKLLSASVTFYKGNPGDSVVIIIPREKHTLWAAVENIIKNNENREDSEI